MLIQKRNGLYQDYDRHKIKNAIIKAFKGIHETINQQHLENILNDFNQAGLACYVIGKIVEKDQFDIYVR